MPCTTALYSPADGAPAATSSWFAPSGTTIFAAESNAVHLIASPCSRKNPFLSPMKNGTSLDAFTVPTVTSSSAHAYRRKAGAPNVAAVTRPEKVLRFM